MRAHDLPQSPQGREVSCEFLASFFTALHEKALPVATLTRNTGYSEQHLHDVRGRISWKAFCAFMRSAGQVWSEAELVELGTRILQAEGPMPLSSIASRLLSPSDLYSLLGRRGRTRAHRFFTCLEKRAWEVTPQHFVVEVSLHEQYEPCLELYLVLKGTLSAVPTLLGLPTVAVKLEWGERRALYHLELPLRTSLITSGRRALRRLRTLPAVVDELQATHDVLNSQYEALRRAQTTLSESEARFRALIENSSDFILLAGAKGNVQYLSPSAERITGYETAELLEKRHADLAHPDDRAAVIAAIDGLALTRIRTTTLCFRFQTKSRRWIWLEGTAKDMLDDPLVRAVLVNYRDVTDRVRLEEQLLQSRKLESIGRLAGGIAHDFNNLLTGVLGNAQLALMQLDARNSTRERIEQIVEYAHRAADLTSQLLAFARKQVVKPQRINLNGLVTQTRSLLDRLIGDQVEIVTFLEAALGNVEVDPTQFQQVIVNLAINARDAMPNGGTLTIATANVGNPAEGGRAILFSVSDTGTGMDEETVVNVFEPFFTTKGLGQGTGLGLATCHGIVSQAGGRIEVSSRPGSGTTFRVYLPRVDGAAALELVEAEIPIAPRGFETLLLVDDDIAVRQSTSELLRSLGYSILTAENGLDALQVAERFQGEVHAVITDVVMPKVGGPELVERLRCVRPGIQWLFISGYAGHGQTPALPEGAPVVQKPFDIATLAVKLRELLQPTSTTLLESLASEVQLAAPSREVSGRINGNS